MLTLVGRSLARVAGLFAGLLGLLAGFQFLLIAVAASYANANTFDRVLQLAPSFAREAFGSSLSSFSGMATLGYFHPLPLMLVVQFAIYLATEPAGEIEFGLVDLILARPLPRHRLVTRTLVMMMIAPVALTLTMGLATWAGLWSLAPPGARWPEARVVLSFIVHLTVLAWCFGAAALAATAWARRRGSVQALVAVAAVALFLLDFVAAAWAPARPFARLSPFHYYQGTAILAGTADSARDLSILGAAAVVGIAVAYWQFARRDL